MDVKEDKPVSLNVIETEAEADAEIADLEAEVAEPEVDIADPEKNEEEDEKKSSSAEECEEGEYTNFEELD